MDSLLWIAAIIAFVPTLALMYLILKKYTYPAVEQPFFSDPAFFGLFAVGLVVGTILVVVFMWVGFVNVIYTILMSFVEVLAMVIILNLKRFHGKSDTVFYGYGLGLGIGCTFVYGLVFTLTSLLSSAEGLSTVSQYAIFTVFGVSSLLVLSSIGTMIGEGIARLKPMEFALQSIMVAVVFNLILSVTFSQSNDVLFYLFLILGLIFAASIFYRTMVLKLSNVVKDVLKMEGNKRKDVPK